MGTDSSKINIGIVKIILEWLNTPFSGESHRCWLSPITYYLSAMLLQVKNETVL
jgi:hypothetical protein